MKKQRILFLHLGQSFGGIEVYMANLAALLRDDAHIIALCSHPELIERLHAQGVHVIRFSAASMCRGPLRGFRFPLAALLLPFVILRHRIDTVHINGHWESMLLIPCRLLGRRSVSTRHQTWDIPVKHWWNAPKRTLAALTYNMNVRFANHVICVSEAVAAEVRTRLSTKKISVIPNWVASQPDFIERGLPTTKTQLLFVGRMVIFKGLQLVIEAMRELPHVALTAVGEGAMLEAYREQARGLDVTFAGFHHDVTPFYRSADIFVMPSIGLEGLPLVSLEAMGHALPCLFSDLPVHRDITANGTAAALFRTGDVHDLRCRLRALIDDHSYCQHLGRQGYVMVQRRFSATVARQSYLHTFGLHGKPSSSGETTYEDRTVLPQRPVAAE